MWSFRYECNQKLLYDYFISRKKFSEMTATRALEGSKRQGP